jgi:hypothetical protein
MQTGYLGSYICARRGVAKAIGSPRIAKTKLAKRTSDQRNVWCADARGGGIGPGRGANVRGADPQPLYPNRIAALAYPMSMMSRSHRRGLNSSVDRLYYTDIHHRPRQRPRLLHRNKRADALCDSHLLCSPVKVVVQFSLQQRQTIRLAHLMASNAATTELPLRTPQSRSVQEAWYFWACCSLRVDNKREIDLKLEIDLAYHPSV